VDFRVMYYPARCLVQHGDPYNEAQVLSLYRATGGDNPSDSEKVRQIATRYIYLPSAFCFTVPFALMPWGPAHILWLMLTMAGLIFASVLVWSLAAEYAPVAAGALICLFLVNSELLIISANAAGIVVSLCAVAVWCFLRNRFVPAGILCLAIALAVKPQDSGLVWLYFLLAGGLYRKRALQTLLVTAVLSLPALLWVWHAAPAWAQEWQSNLAILSARGGISDPGPTSLGGHGLANVISLQSVISVFRDDPRVYNPASYLVCAPLLLIWIAITLAGAGHRGRTHPVARLSPPVRRQATAARRSRLRHALGREWDDRKVCAPGHDCEPHLHRRPHLGAVSGSHPALAPLYNRISRTATHGAPGLSGPTYPAGNGDLLPLGLHARPSTIKTCPAALAATKQTL